LDGLLNVSDNNDRDAQMTKNGSFSTVKANGSLEAAAWTDGGKKIGSQAQDHPTQGDDMEAAGDDGLTGVFSRRSGKQKRLSDVSRLMVQYSPVLIRESSWLVVNL